MRFVFFLVCLLICTLAQSQNFILPRGEYMDTTVTLSPKCDSLNLFYYYQVDTKYPESSMAVLIGTKGFLVKKGKKYNGSGYVTLRFIVDCEGVIHKVKVLQTDENYQPYRFDKGFVSDLNAYIHTLDKWEKNISINEYKNVNYIAYITFKIRNGEVINVIY